MKIDENYSIEPEACSWNLVYQKEGGINKKTGKPTVTSWIQYHSNLRYALEAYLHESLRECAEVSEVLGAIRAAEDRISSLVFAVDPQILKRLRGQAQARKTRPRRLKEKLEAI